jgi:hypothetical protein
MHKWKGRRRHSSVGSRVLCRRDKLLRSRDMGKMFPGLGPLAPYIPHLKKRDFLDF